MTAFCAVLSLTASAQQTVEAQMGQLKQQVETLQRQMDDLSKRLAGVEQLNVDLRKALDFGKPITTVQGKNGVTYKLISLKGDKEGKTLKAVFQIAITKEMSEVNLYRVSSRTSYVDLYGNRKETNNYSVGNKEVVTIFKDAPTNGMITFYNVDVDQVQEIKLLRFDCSIDGHTDMVHFKNLKVDWH